MDLVNFQVGAKTVALPILNILLTERFGNDLTELPNENPSFIGVKDFMNLPIPVFDLGKILNGSSTSDSNKSLAATLSNLKDDVQTWLSNINAAVVKPSSALNVLSPDQTSFNKWLDDFKCDNEDLIALLNKINEPTNELYEYFIEHGTEGKTANWERLFSTSKSHIQRLFESVIEQVELGYKPIIVFTTTDGREPHVGLLVDKVEDSLHVDEANIKSLDTVTSVGFSLDKQTRSMMQGLIQLENKHSLIIDPSSLFTETDI
jgi:purine-binding chemotaxis protein CheW